MKDDPSLDARRRAFVLLHQRAGKDDIGIAGCLGEEEVDHGEELETLERLSREVEIGCGDHRIRADEEQTADLPGVDRLEDVDVRQPLVWERLFRNAPDAGDVLPVLGILDVAGAGELIALLPCSRPPCPLPWPVIVAYPQPSRPIRPVARTRLIAAMQFSTPFEWCSSPRA